MTAEHPAAQAPTRPRVALATILLAYLHVGLTAFGFSILQRLKSLVLERHWLSEEEMNEGLALVQLYPGPIMVDFTAYVGYKLRGVPGAGLATLGFILPSFILMLALSAAYFAAGNLPWVHPLFLGLEALVVGVVLNVTLDFGGRALKGRVEALLALGAFVALAFQANAVLIVLAALGLGALLLRPAGKGQAAPAALHSAVATPGRWVAIGAVIATVLAVAAGAWALRSEVGQMALAFFKIGSVAFGSGMTILPLIQSEVVDVHHWLTLSQFADGIALGQITPGPFLITAAFVGYKMGGILGATLAAFGMFSPSFAMTLAFTELFSRLRNLAAIRGALAGVLAAFVGLLASVTLQLAGVGIAGPASLALAAGAFVAVRFFKLDILWVFLGGLALWAGLMAAGVAG
jgi:chromate transporter